jgi:hypothetical protein
VIVVREPSITAVSWVKIENSDGEQRQSINFQSKE